MQYFHWYISPHDSLWGQVSDEVQALAANGITALWLPPAYKGESGQNDVGYGVYDLYDLGEFEQKGGIPTKYGTKQQYLNAISAAHAANVQVYGDVVFNHRGGGDKTEWVKAIRVLQNDHNFEVGDQEWIEAYTTFTFPGRRGAYSDFVWRYYHFDGVDYAANMDSGKQGIFKFLGLGKDWEKMVCAENGNYDYLMYCDLDMNHPEVRTELARWGRWYLDISNVDGFRFDAVKHIQFSFFRNWLDDIRRYSHKDLFAVGEYWDPGNVDALHNFIAHTHGKMSLFDAPLHRNFYQASRSNGTYDMRTIFDRTLVKDNPTLAVTLVDNHDTQPLQALESPVDYWFKPHAYAMILLREAGYPCVFYPDYYGASYSDKGIDIYLAEVPHLKTMLSLRRDTAHGKQHDYLNDPDIIGWTREGLQGKTGVAVVLTNRSGGAKWMYVGMQHAGKVYADVLRNSAAQTRINEYGWGEFMVRDGSVSVYCEAQV
ncbi:MAG: alpha-amylase [Deltaproteobacteria bacterium]|nr:alpha-amylase [Deltaproteobacteria bacterium]MBN2671945.1 alpha-amylase [Deltaproteobacteria bacterium]